MSNPPEPPLFAPDIDRALRRALDALAADSDFCRRAREWHAEEMRKQKEEAEGCGFPPPPKKKKYDIDTYAMDLITGDRDVYHVDTDPKWFGLEVDRMCRMSTEITNPMECLSLLIIRIVDWLTVPTSGAAQYRQFITQLEEIKMKLDTAEIKKINKTVCSLRADIRRFDLDKRKSSQTKP